MKTNELFLNLGNNISFKDESLKDKDFLQSLYASTRENELSISGMTQIEKKNFISQQFELRQIDYKRKFYDAQYLIIQRKKKYIGRLVFSLTSKVHLIDIAFVKKARANGFGTKILNNLISYACKQNQTFKLSVSIDNPRALKLYQSLGLKIIDRQGHYYLMEINH